MKNINLVLFFKKVENINYEKKIKGKMYGTSNIAIIWKDKRL